MWRRNGYSLQHQIFFYHNARCRGEMFDRDIQLIQFCAANMDPDKFILQVTIMIVVLPRHHDIHQVLDKYCLVHWSEKDFLVSEEESIRHLTSLVEECLGLLFTVLGERFVILVIIIRLFMILVILVMIIKLVIILIRFTPGVGRITAEQMVRKEIVQLLCVEPMSHSALNKALPEDVNHETGL